MLHKTAPHTNESWWDKIRRRILAKPFLSLERGENGGLWQLFWMFRDGTVEVIKMGNYVPGDMIEVPPRTTSIYVDPTPKTHPPLCDRNCNECPLLIAKNGRMITRILNELHERFGEDVTQIVNGLCPNLTVCFDCRIDDFVHFEGCDLAGDDQHMTAGTDTPE